MILIARSRERGVLRPVTGLEDNRRDFDSTKYGPADGSAMLSGQPISDGGAEAKDRAGPSAGQCGRLAQYFQYSSHSITPWKRAMNWDCESTQIGAVAGNEKVQNVGSSVVQVTTAR